MRFYKIDGFVNNGPEEEVEDRRLTRRLCTKMREKSNVYNMEHKRTYFSISEYSTPDMTIGVLVREKIDLNKAIDEYSKYLKFDFEILSIEEITFGKFVDLIEDGRRDSFTEDPDKVLKKLGIEPLPGRGYRGIEYGENIAGEITKEEMVHVVDNYLFNESMEPEVARIYTENQAKRLYGHPVHYMVMTDDHDTRNDIYRALIGALEANGRLDSKRYAFTDIDPDRYLEERALNALYTSCIGGTMVIRYRGGEVEEDDVASGVRESVNAAVQCMKKYRNNVLTIFCLPRECTKIKSIFYEYLGSISIVELKEDFADAIRAKTYLKFLAKNSHIRTDKNLLNQVKDDQLYLSNDLKQIFDIWYDRKLKTSLYPQYKCCAINENSVEKKIAIGTGYDTLQEMIGLTEAKAVIEKALNYYKAQKLYKEKEIDLGNPAMHMVFTGNPGTAKTTVARLFAKIMKENGLLSKGKLIEVGRGDLVGKYVGWTAPIIQQKFKEAMGSVLFIDEAYSLVDDRNGSFGDEAINTIVQEMENHRDDVVVIFAGYPDKMEGFLNKNPGLRSRIAFHVPFSDYSTEELCEIAKLMAKSKSSSLTDEAIEKLSGIFESARQYSDFGNGRYVRNILEMARMNQAGRILKENSEYISREEICTIQAEDIEAPVISGETVKAKIGFCA